MIINCQFMAIYLLVTFAKEVLLTEDFNSLSFNSLGWKCLPSDSNSLIYNCQYGMSLVQLSKECNKIGKTFINIPPHYMIQLYVDFIAYRTIDLNENAIISADNTIIYTYYKLQAGYLHYGNQCDSSVQRFCMSTSISEFSHANTQLTIEFSTNLDEIFSNEGYPFRNLQIYYKPCHYTCKTCSNEAYNSCLSCFTQNSVPSSSQCQTCKIQQNLRFLLQTQGCLQECPDGYNYDQELICYRNTKLINLKILNQIQPMISQEFVLNTNLNIAVRSPLTCSVTEQYLQYYQDEALQTTLNLQSSSVAIRLRATIILIGSWIVNNQLQIKINGQLIDSINFNNFLITTQNSIILYQDQTYQVCLANNVFKIRIEINHVIQQSNLNLSFNGYNLVDQSLSWSIIDVNVEQEICSQNCNICLDRQNCKICASTFVLHKGQCFESCPYFSKMIDNLCIDLDEELIDLQNSKIKYLVKEFYDVSTTQERILELFNFVSGSVNNFGKGDRIYFSYVPDKKVFGGALVWIDAIFKLQQEIPKYCYQVRIKFQVILGDNFDPGNFEYQINNQNNVILTKSSQNVIQQKQIWGDVLQDSVLQVDDIINGDEIADKQLIILLKCNNPSKLINESFCAIQDLFITAEFYCTKEYKLDLYKYENDLYPCISICGDGYVVDEEQCDDGNLYPFDGCFNCRYQCEEFCQNCVQGICLFNLEQGDELQIFQENLQMINQIVYQKENIIRIDYQECQLECQICNDGNCYLCMDGYIIDIITYRCYLLIIGCNYVQSYSIQIKNYVKSSICISDLSYQQQSMYYSNSNKECINCLIFEYQSCNNECSFCYQGQCFKCQNGYTLDNNNDCLSICGDGLLNKDYVNNEVIEQCDNPLIDGCENCIILSGYKCIQVDHSICWTCDEKCLKCTNQNNDLFCNQCIDGYYAVTSFCYKCNDNCITCKDNQELCTSCYRDDCQKCEDIPGLYTDLDIKKCMPLCGDGIRIQFYEQCDDGNVIDGDGCDSNCNSEFQEETYSFVIERLNGQTSNDLSITHDSNINLNCKNTTIIVEGFDQTQFNYNSTTTDKGCQIIFKFFKSIRKINLIHIYISFQDIQTRLLQQYKEIQVSPVEQIILDDKQKSQADAISDAQSSFSLLIWILAPLSILLGLFDYLWAVLEILSWINNFYFFNVNFPFNVQILFLNSDWSSIISFPTYQNFNQPGCDYYFESPPRFTEKGVDPLFINNAQVPIFFIFTSILLYLLSFLILQIFKFIDKTLQKKIRLHGHSTFSVIKSIDVHLHNQTQSQFQYEHNKYSFFIVKKLIIISNSFYSRIKQTITLCLLDLTMAITLQLIFGKQFQHSMILINNILALLFCLLLIYQLTQSYFVIGIHQSLAKVPHFQLRYGCYYENINIQNTFGLKYNFFGLIRKITYIFCIVYFYQNPLIQTTLCFVTCSSGVLLLLYSNPFESKGQFYKQLISESGLSLITLITILLSIDDLLNKMEESSKIILGWIVISLVILCVSCEIITLLFEICKLLYEKILDLLKLLLNKEQINKNIQTRNDIQEVIEPKILKENKLSFMKHGQLHQFIK